MTNERKEQLAKTAIAIAADCEADAKALDGMPFTGRTVAVQFGNILAAVNALADIVRELAEHGQCESD